VLQVYGALALIVAFAASASWSQTGSDTQPGQLVRDAEQRIRELQDEVDRLAAQSNTLLRELRTLELERAIKAQALRKADAAVAEVTLAVEDSQLRVDTLEAKRQAATDGVRERLVEIYKRGKSGYVSLLFANGDLRALGRMMRAAAAVARLDQLRIEEHRRLIAAEHEALADLDVRRRTLSAAQAEAQKARAALDAAVAAHNRRINDLDERRDLAAQYAGELGRASSELGERMAGMTSAAPSLPIEPFRGALDWPVTGDVVARFGRSTGRLGTAITRNGIEIATTEGTEVHAVHGGQVTFAAPFIGYGTVVIVDHGGNAFTLYGYLQHASVAVGARVERGGMVGRAGRNPDGAEVVYFEVRIDGRPVDPLQWLRAPSEITEKKPR
jgi:septal ring factor EnvC (AmiA/AmiB activator)